MGSGSSKVFDTQSIMRGGTHRFFSNLGPWSLLQVKALFKRFRKNDGSFAIERRQFISLMSFKKPPVIDAGDIFGALDTDHSGRIDCLEFTGLLAFICDCPLDDKIEFLFEMCDFNMNGSLSRNEMFLMMRSTLRGLLKLTGNVIDASLDEELQRIAINAFDMADQDRSDTIVVNEFNTWLRNNSEIIHQISLMTKSVTSAIHDRECDDSADEIDDEEAKDVKDDVETSLAQSSFGPRRLESVYTTVEGVGDEFMATRPWLGAIVEPTGYKKSRLVNEPPDNDLELEWIHGYRGFDCRQNIHVIRKKPNEHGESMGSMLVYHAAGVGITYDKVTHTQRHYFGHSDDIISLAVHPNFHTIATGQIGKNPEIHVWEPDDDYRNLATISGFHSHGVCLLEFSPDGQALASVGLDPDHAIAVHNWKQGRLLASGKGSQQKTLSMAMSQSGEELCIVGVKFIKLFDLGSRSLKGRNAVLGKRAKIQTFLSCAYTLDHLAVGTACGDVYILEGNHLVDIVSAHTGPVNCLYSHPTGLLSGGKDGKVVFYDNHLKLTQTVDLISVPYIDCNNYEVRSVTLDTDLSLIVGTRGCEIALLNLEQNKGEVLTTGHYDGELWGIDVHPTQQQYATVGDESLLMIWDARRRMAIRRTRLPGKGRCVAYNSKGEHLAVGLTTGAVCIYDAESLRQVTIFQHSSRPIQVAKYSPATDAGELLAVGSHDGKIYIYSVLGNKYGKKCICRGHSSTITHLDFSDNSKYLQSNCAGYELLFWDVKGTQITSPSTLRDVAWATWTCTLGWPVQGIWPKESDGTDVNAVCRSWSQSFLATGDDFGRVSLFRYPCPNKRAGNKLFIGHSSHVTNVAFTYGDMYLLSTGGNDKCVFQWRHVQGDSEPTDLQELPLEDAALPSDRRKMLQGALEGDQFLAVRPYQGAIRAPSSFVEKPGMSDSPNANMALEWIYGYRAQDCRNNLKYTKLGEVVYMSAATNIVYDQGHRQRFHKDHTDDIISLAMDPTLRFVATGEVGKKPKLIVWDTTSMESISILSGLLARGVCEVSFDRSGTLVAGVGMDDQHTLAVYQWQQKRLVHVAKGGQQKVLALEYSPFSDELVSAGQRHIKFWSPNGSTLSARKGILGKARMNDAVDFYSLTFTSLYTVAGGSNGQLYLFSGSSLARTVPCHTGAVFALCSYVDAGDECILSGGKDGRVLSWTLQTLDTGKDFKEVTYTSVSEEMAPIRALCRLGGSTLVGTQKSDIFELRGEKPKIVTQGHSAGELWGLSACPVKKLKEFCTCGDDRTLRIWDFVKRQCVRKVTLRGKGRTCEYSPDGNHIAVGLMDGMVSVFAKELKDSKELLGMREIQSFQNSTQWISDIKYSSRHMAVGSHDCQIYIYSYSETEYSFLTKCRGHSSYITHLDFSADGRYLQSNCGAYELLYWQVETGQQVKNASSVRDVAWASWTCTLGWPVQGIWPKESDGTDVNAVCRSTTVSDDPEDDNLILATGDDFGRVNLFKYPCLRKGANSHSFAGHSSHVTCVRFLVMSQRLVSVGGLDRSILQWDVDIDNMTEDAQEAPLADYRDEETEWFSGSAPLGDEFMAVKPWLGAIKEPSTFKPDKSLSSEPDENLELEWVHGYTTGPCRNNLRYSNEGDIVYNAAALGIIYDLEKHRMHFQRNHTDDIISLAMSPSGHCVATGEIGAKPKICVWDSYSGSGVTTIKGFHTSDSTKLASIGLDDYHSIAVYRLDGTMIATSRSSTAKVLHVTFLLNTELVTCGVNTIKFWTLRGSDLNSKNGVFGRQGKSQTILCVTPYGSDCVSGQSDGSLYLWKGNQCSNKVTAHNAGVNALYTYSEGMISGSQDGVIIIWGRGLTVLTTIRLSDLKGAPSVTAVNSVCINKDHSALLVGTRGSDVFELNLQTGSLSYINRGHYKGELWGLVMNPSRDCYATAGDDGTIRTWDARDRVMQSCVSLKGNARALAYSPNGSHLALGMQSGALLIYSSDLKTLLATQACGKKWIQTLGYSPDGLTLAVGCHDTNIYLFNTNPYSRRAVCSAHSSYITHLDFSVDSKHLQSNCGAYELLFWRVETGQQVKNASSVRDVAWATWTCTLGWPVQGIWPKESDGTDVNAVCRSPDGKLLATADDFGKVKLFRYPCLSKENRYKTYTGHSSHVTNIRFSGSQSYVVSTGGADKCVFQFRVTQ